MPFNQRGDTMNTFNRLFYIIVLVLISGILVTAGFSQNKKKDASNDKCFECHGDSSIEAKSDRGKKLLLYVDKELYSEGAHQEFYCIECHNNRDCPEYYERPVEETAKIEQRDCEECHKKYFHKEEEEYKKSVHYTEIGEKFNCTSCHDQHTMTPTLTEQNVVFYDVMERIRSDNNQCLNCHTNEERYSLFKKEDEEMPDIHQSHSFLPNAELHWDSVRCIDCHTPMDKIEYHNILERDKSKFNCIECHTAKSMLSEKLYMEPRIFNDFKFINTGFFSASELKKRYKNAGINIAQIIEEQEKEEQEARTPGEEGNILNKYLFDNAYVIGATRNTFIDYVALIVILLSAIGVLIHGGIRFVADRLRPFQAGNVETEYLYSLHTRIWHWVNAILFLILVVTGFNMHFADIDDSILPFDLSVELHNISALLLIVGYLFYLVTSIINGNIKNYMPNFGEIFTRLYRQTRFYLYDIFLGRPHPYPPEKGNKFNPLQKATYIVVMFILFPVLIVSGIVMFFPSIAPEEMFKYPGIYPIALVHYITSILFVIFLIIHVYLSTTGDRVSYLLKGMITGYHISEHKKHGKD